MKIFVVLCLVTVALARKLHYRQNVNSWTQIGRSYFKVFDDVADWHTAQSNCENLVSGSVYINDEKVNAVVGHLAYDKNEEIHQFLTSAMEDSATRKSTLTVTT